MAGARTKARPPQRDAETPLWAQVQTDLERRLEAGTFRDGFPGELALVEEYGVSRHTIREALRSLRASGTVLAGRGQRPRVAEVHQQSVGALWSLFRAIEERGQVQESDVLALDVRHDPAAAERLELDPEAELVYVERLRRVDGVPLAWDRAWLPAEQARPLLEADFRHTALYDELARHCGIVVRTGSETIEARTADPALRTILKLPRDAAALVLTRVGFQKRKPVELRETYVRGDQFKLTVHWGADGASKLDLRGDLTAD